MKLVWPETKTPYVVIDPLLVDGEAQMSPHSLRMMVEGGSIGIIYEWYIADAVFSVEVNAGSGASRHPYRRRWINAQNVKKGNLVSDSHSTHPRETERANNKLQRLYQLHREVRHLLGKA